MSKSLGAGRGPFVSKTADWTAYAEAEFVPITESGGQITAYYAPTEFAGAGTRLPPGGSILAIGAHSGKVIVEDVAVLRTEAVFCHHLSQAAENVVKFVLVAPIFR